ncbi:TPR_REGION domain-containing protein [Paraburkholderia tropica]|uniref:tetratricopeptide repeat protein n=1 Tax=Paraburkholderia tropica TaxID=92647 RepID=UPI001CAABF7D|nr:tetratricopeptide repeat protein [Paraburkholderia tropica]CAG9225729.1 TPR_REGION domain-containing protein [Paraburkholderia tropica]
MADVLIATEADSIEALSQALDAAPLDIGLHTRMLAALRAAHDLAGSAAHELALAAFGLLGATHGDQPTDQHALVLYNIATVYAMNGRRKDAIRWYRHALRVDPALAIAHQNLAATLDREGLADEARVHRERAYRLQRVFVDPAIRAEQLRVLILGVGQGTGNVPIDALLDAQTTTRIRYAIDCADEAEDAQLPPHDVVFNGIGDADVAARTPELAARLTRFAARCERPLLNAPEAIGRTHRHRLETLLDGVPDVIVPRCVRFDERPSNVDELAAHLAQAKLTLPLLLRPLAAHGGEGVTLHASIESLWHALADVDAPCYLTAFHDFRAADGHYRKYRTLFVAGEPYPYHLAISRHWMVHYFSAEMAGNPWKLNEEQHFLADPRAALGERANDAIRAIGERLGLAYGGVDFTLTADGRVLVFEANATMLAHRETPHGPFAHKNHTIERIIDAFGRMLRDAGAR